jgi:hypothetical protein
MTSIEKNVYPEHLDDKQVGTHVAWHGHMHKVNTSQYGARTLCGPQEYVMQSHNPRESERDTS